MSAPEGRKIKAQGKRGAGHAQPWVSSDKNAEPRRGGRSSVSAKLLSPLRGSFRYTQLSQGCGPLSAALALGFILVPLRGTKQLHKVAEDFR